MTQLQDSVAAECLAPGRIDSSSVHGRVCTDLGVNFFAAFQLDGFSGCRSTFDLDYRFFLKEEKG